MGKQKKSSTVVASTISLRKIMFTTTKSDQNPICLTDDFRVYPETVGLFEKDNENDGLGGYFSDDLYTNVKDSVLKEGKPIVIDYHGVLYDAVIDSVSAPEKGFLRQMFLANVSPVD